MLIQWLLDTGGRSSNTVNGPGARQANRRRCKRKRIASRLCSTTKSVLQLRLHQNVAHRVLPVYLVVIIVLLIPRVHPLPGVVLDERLERPALRTKFGQWHAPNVGIRFHGLLHGNSREYFGG